MQKKIWLSSPHMGGSELTYIHEAFDNNWIAPLGPNVDEFEKSLGNYLNIPHVAALNSGTAAIHLALILSGVKSGDSVLCQSFTFSASANPILYLGAEPIFIDSEMDTWNLDPLTLEVAILASIKEGKKPKACIVVHLYGMPAKILEIQQICLKYNIRLIEDAAEALGSSFKNQKLGTFGDFGILSFNGNKIITTSGGGALISNDEKLIDKARFLSTQARDPFPHYQHSNIGYNYRMSNISAGIGRGQLLVLDEWVRRRRSNFDFYKRIFENFPFIESINESEGSFSNRWLSTFLFPELQVREKIRKELARNNIESRPLWKPMHLQPIFSKYKSYINGNSKNLFNNGLCLPSGSNLSTIDLNKIENILTKYLQTI